MNLEGNELTAQAYFARADQLIGKAGVLIALGCSAEGGSAEETCRAIIALLHAVKPTVRQLGSL